MHWGSEENLTSAHDTKDIVKDLADAKVDILVGSHPHVEGHYFYRGILVVFSLGNFLTPMHVRVYVSELFLVHNKMDIQKFDVF